jgi:hypothetical protein
MEHSERGRGVAVAGLAFQLRMGFFKIEHSAEWPLGVCAGFDANVVIGILKKYSQSLWWRLLGV